MSHVPFAVSVLAAALGVLPQGAAAKPDDPLARYRGTNRIVVALAASSRDPALAAQRRIFAAMGPGARERDLVLVEAIDGTANGSALRERFGGLGFRAVLIGKDGGAKFEADHPLGADALFPLIDAMPMRQDEMRRAPRGARTL